MDRSRGFAFCAVVLLLAPFFAFAGAEEPAGIGAKLRPVLDQAMAQLDVPGMAVAVLEGGEPVFVETRGVADLAAPDRHVTPDTLFGIASITKTFVAVAVLQLAEQGRLDLDAHPRKYLPYFTPADPRAERMTIRQLLSHTSGIPDDRDPAFSHPEFDASALERFVRSGAALALDSAPGAKFGYSNFGYCILGDVVAKVSGEAFEDYVKRHILEPVGMSSTELLLPAVKKKAWAHPFVIDDAYAVVPSPHFPYNRRRAPASSVHSSLHDMIRWARVHLNHGELDGKRILKAATYEEMWKPAGEAFPQIGLGWFLWRRDGLAVVGHNGSDTGFVADLEMIPERGIAAIVLCNLDRGPYRPIVLAALDAALGKTPATVFKPSLAKAIHQVLSVDGVDAAIARYRQLRNERPARYDFNEWVLNDLGYKLMARGRFPEAVRILRLNAAEYPDSANVYDSLGEACLRAGDNACALENYLKALEKNPGNAKAADMVKKLRR